MIRTWSLGTRTLLAVALFAPACMHAPPNEEAAPTADLAPETTRAPVLTTAPRSTATEQPAGLAWKVAAAPTRVPEFQGKSVTLAKGARCTVFRALPSLNYTTNTLVRDACIRIPNGTTVEVREGATLAIVATSELFIGKDVVFDAKGSRGGRGARAEFAALGYAATTDAEIQALCVDQGNRCPCPTDSGALATIRGKPGADGTPGGSIRLIAGALLSPSRLAGFQIDTSGGVGGPPGDSGTQECGRGQLRCSSEACSAGALSGATGPRGSVFVSIGGSSAAAARGRLTASLGTPAPADAIALGTDTDVAARVAELDTLAVQKGWVRRAADELE